MALPIPVSEASVMAAELEIPLFDFLSVITPADALYVNEINRRNSS